MIRALRTGRGSTTVELAIVGPLVLFLLFACIEFGLMMRGLMLIKHAASSAGRVAAVGAGAAEIEATVQSESSLPAVRLTVTSEFRTYDPGTGTWGTWGPISGGEAVSGDEIRVHVTYDHELIMDGLFGSMTGEDSAFELQSTAVTFRE